VEAAGKASEGYEGKSVGAVWSEKDSVHHSLFDVLGRADAPLAQVFKTPSKCVGKHSVNIRYRLSDNESRIVGQRNPSLCQT
jgi:hypothetical protein